MVKLELRSKVIGASLHTKKITVEIELLGGFFEVVEVPCENDEITKAFARRLGCVGTLALDPGHAGDG